MVFFSFYIFTILSTLLNPAVAFSGPSHTPRKVVIVGGGIGGLSSAFDARHILHHDDEIQVISDRADFQFTPSNPWVGVRIRSEKDISLPLANILPSHRIGFLNAAVTHLEPNSQQITLDNGSKVDYDFLIIATGPRLGFDEVPGMGPDHHSSSICVTPHAKEAADALDRLVDDPGPIVMGAVQGSSCFGPAYEFAMLVHNELQKRGGSKLLNSCPISFITPEPYIGHLGLKGSGDSEKVLTELLKERNIAAYTNCKVNKVASDYVSISYLDKDMKPHSEKLPTKFTMLIPPFRGMNVWKHVPGLTDRNGMILTDNHQRSLKFPNIFGVGVCAHLDPLEKTYVATGVPKTGYMIESMGTAAVKNIKHMMDHPEDKDSLPYRALLNGLCITDFGGDGAMFLSMPQMPPRKTDVTIHGKIATLSKIAFEKYFLHKIQTGDTDPYYEKYMLHLLGVDRIALDVKSTKA